MVAINYEENFFDHFNRVFLILLSFLILGLLSLFLFYGWGFGTVLIWTLAFYLASGFLGFLFGIPKVLQTDGAENTAAKGPFSYRMIANTNIEQISDWLTKIIVGLGLIELKNFDDYLYGFAKDLHDAHPNISIPVAQGIIVYFSTLGFISIYLITRLYISRTILLLDRTNHLDLSQEAIQNIATDPLERTKYNQNLTDASKEKLIQVADQNLDSLNSDELIIAYSKANFKLGRLKNALVGFQKALKRKKGDAELLYNYALTKYIQGASHQECYELLKEAADTKSAQLDLDLKKKLYRDLTYHALYLPGGHKEAAKYAAVYVSDRNNIPSSSVYINLACAYGQMYKRDPEADREALVKKAIIAMEKAIEISPKAINTLRTLTQTNIQKSKDENDLEVFEQEPQVRKLLGLDA